MNVQELYTCDIIADVCDYTHECNVNVSVLRKVLGMSLKLNGSDKVELITYVIYILAFTYLCVNTKICLTF